MFSSTASSRSTSALFALTLAVSSAIAGRVPFELVKERAGARTSSPVSGGSILAGAPVSNITVTPSGVVQCGTATVQWTGVVEPVQLFIAVGGMYVGETPLATLSGLSGGSTTWQVAASAGDTLIFQVTDATNQVGYIQNIPVQGSTDTSCLSAASAAGSSSASASGDGTASASPSSSDDNSSAASSTDVASTPLASASPNAGSSSDADAAAVTSSSSKGKASASATQAAVTAATTPALTIATPKTTASAVTSVGLAGAQSTPQSSVTNGASSRAGPAIGIATLLSGAAILACLL